MSLIPKKIVVIILTIVLSTGFSIISNAQNLKTILSKEGENDSELWKKDRLNYYLDNQSVETKSKESFYYKGNEKMRLGLYKEAIISYKKAIKDEKSPETISTLEKAISNTNVYMNLSVCFTQLENYDSAVYYCEQAINEDKYYEDAYMQKAYILLAKNQSKQALAFLDETELVFPESKNLFYERGNIYLQLNKITKAKRYIRKAIKIDPDFEEARLMLVKIHIATYNIEAAMRELKRSINESKEPLLSLYYRTYIYLLQNKLGLAYKDISRAYEIDSSSYTVGILLSGLSYYFENYDFANELLLKSWNNAYRSDSTYDPYLETTDIENGYFINYVNEEGHELEKDLFNKYNYNLFHDYDDENDELIKNYLNEFPNSVFALRLDLENENFNVPYYLNFLKNDRVLYFNKDIPLTNLLAFRVDYVNKIDNLFRLDSNIISLNWRKCQIELIKENYDTAVILANKAISLDSTFLNSYKLRGFAELLQGNYENCIRDFNHIIDNSNSVENCILRGIAIAYFKKGDYIKAIEANQEILDIDPRSWDFNNTGLTYAMINNYDSALLYYDKAISMRKYNAKFYEYKAAVYQNMGDTISAIEVLKTGSENSSNNVLLVDIADIYLSIKDYDNALIYYEKVNKLNKEYTYAIIGMADCYRNKFELKKAHKYYDKAIDQKPKHAYTYYAKALCYEVDSNYTETLRWALEAIKISEEYTDALALAAESAFKLKKYNASYSFGLRAYKADPTKLDNLFKLGEYVLAKGSYEAAVTLYDQITEQFNKEENLKSYNQARERLKKMYESGIYSDDVHLVMETYF